MSKITFVAKPENCQTINSNVEYVPPLQPGPKNKPKKRRKKKGP